MKVEIIVVGGDGKGIGKWWGRSLGISFFVEDIDNNVMSSLKGSEKGKKESVKERLLKSMGVEKGKMFFFTRILFWKNTKDTLYQFSPTRTEAFYLKECIEEKNISKYTRKSYKHIHHTMYMILRRIQNPSKSRSYIII